MHMKKPCLYWRNLTFELNKPWELLSNKLLKILLLILTSLKRKRFLMYFSQNWHDYFSQDHVKGDILPF